jgi:hypothetical protein
MDQANTMAKRNNKKSIKLRNAVLRRVFLYYFRCAHYLMFFD